MGVFVGAYLCPAPALSRSGCSKWWCEISGLPGRVAQSLKQSKSKIKIQIESKASRAWDEMDDIAEQIVKRARMMPDDTAVRLESNGIVIAKVKVTGGIGLEVRSGSATLLFPKAGIKKAVETFLVAAHTANVDINSRYSPIVRHANGIAMLTFQWNCKKDHASAMASLVEILESPPLCETATEVEKVMTPMDTQGGVGLGVGTGGH